MDEELVNKELVGQFGQFHPECSGQWLNVLMDFGDKRFPSGVHVGISILLLNIFIRHRQKD